MSALATVSAPKADLASIDGLVAWVIEADVEEVCWRITEIGTLREWAQAQKDATALRMKAVRLELIALRKIAQGGLSAKIGGAPQLRSCAKWLATLSADEFGEVLEQIDGERSPIGLYRADKAQRDAMAEALSKEQRPSNWQHVVNWKRPPVSVEDGAELRSAATVLLRDLLDEGEPFTVSEAAERLGQRMGLDVEVRGETAEGLREMVRSAIRHGSRNLPVNAWAIVPVAFTVEQADGEYVRVPASKASIGHLVAHEREVRRRAEATMKQADELRSLAYFAMREVGVDIDEVGFLTDDPETEILLASPLAPIIDKYRQEDGYAERVAS